MKIMQRINEYKEARKLQKIRKMHEKNRRDVLRMREEHSNMMKELGLE